MQQLEEKGFTLMELMIVVAILGMVAAVGIPSYLDYIAKSQVSEAVTLVSAAKTPLAEFYGNNGRIPSTSEIGVTTEGKFVSDITIISTSTNVVIRATFKPLGVSVNIANQTYAIAANSDLTDWQCGLAGSVSSVYTSTEYNYLPTSCR